MNPIEPLEPVAVEARRFLSLLEAYTHIVDLESDEASGDVLVESIMRSMHALGAMCSASSERPPEPEADPAGTRRGRRGRR